MSVEREPLPPARPLDCGPGKVFVLEVPESHPEFMSDEAERLAEQFARQTGGSKLIVLPPGCKLAAVAEAVRSAERWIFAAALLAAERKYPEAGEALRFLAARFEAPPGPLKNSPADKPEGGYFCPGVGTFDTAEEMLAAMKAAASGPAPETPCVPPLPRHPGAEGHTTTAHADQRARAAYCEALKCFPEAGKALAHMLAAFVGDRPLSAAESDAPRRFCRTAEEAADAVEAGEGFEMPLSVKEPDTWRDRDPLL